MATGQSTTDDVIMNCDDVTESVADIMEVETDIEEEKGADNDDITCQTCFEAFTSEADFQLHQLQHQMENPFKCAICNDAFPRAELLTKHIQKHQSELKATKLKSVSKIATDNKPTLNLKADATTGKKVSKATIQNSVKNTSFPIATVRRSARKRKPVRSYERDDSDELLEVESSESVPAVCTAQPDNEVAPEKALSGDDVTPIDCDVTTHEPTAPQTSSQSKVVYVTADASDMADSVKCDRCGQSMYSKYHLLVHLDSCDGTVKEKKGRKNERIKCPYCNKPCTEWFLKHHVEYYHPEKTGDEKPEPVLEFPKGTAKKNQPEKCETCFKICMSPWHLKIHMQIHERQDSMGLAITGKKVKVYPCPDCSRVFIHKGSWQSHRKRHHLSDTRYPCDLCDKTFISPLGLTQHKLLHNEEWPYSCDICEKPFKRKDAIWTHKKRKHENMLGESTQKRSYFCSLCQDVFPSDHKKTQHGFDESGPTRKRNPVKVMCELCGKWYGGRYILKQHVESVHEKNRKYACDICGQKFLATQALRTHIKTHSSERPYLCDTCGKSFGNRSQLLKHGAVHVTVKAFTCDTCGKGFASQLRLNRHKTIHVANRPPPERKYACDLCGRTFTMRRYLRDHEATHYREGDRPFNCVICGLRFAQEMDLEAHSLDHDGHRKIDCPDCPDIHFKGSEQFHFHLREIHGKEPDPRILALIEARKNAKNDHPAKPVQKVYQAKSSRNRVPNTSQASATTSTDSSYLIDAVLNKAAVSAPEAHRMTTLTFVPGNVGRSGEIRASEAEVGPQFPVPQITPGPPVNYGGVHYPAGYWATHGIAWEMGNNG